MLRRGPAKCTQHEARILSVMSVQCGLVLDPSSCLYDRVDKSALNEDEDVVAMIPLANISAEIIHTWWKKVLEEVTKIGFDVVATSLDAHGSICMTL